MELYSRTCRRTHD